MNVSPESLGGCTLRASASFTGVHVAKRDVIDIRVSQRILWIGAEAYPVQNIARAQTVRVVPRRGAAVWGYVKAIVLWLLLGLVAAAVMSSADAVSVGGKAFDVGGLATFVVVVLIVISTVRLILNLARPTLYALVVETTGGPRTAVISRSQNLVAQIVHGIMDAINNPHAEFQYRVENLHVGDNFHQFGNQNVGKVAR
jgi:hypothetical protein